MSTGEILDGALALLRRHFGLFCGIAAASQGLPAALDVYIEVSGGGAQHQGLGLLSRVLSAFGTALVTGATARAVSEAYLGGAPTLSDALSWGGSRLGRVFGAGFATGFLTILALLALVIPGIIVACGYSVALEVAALEGESASPLRRSWALTKGFRGKALTLWAICIVLIMVMVLGAGIAGGAAEAVSSAMRVPVTVAVSLIVLLFYPMLTSVFTLFYYDLRVRKEAFDLELLSRHLGIPART